MSVMAAAGIVVGGFVLLAALFLGIACRDWRPAASFLGIVTGAVLASLAMAYAMAALVGDAAGFWEAF